MSPRPLPAAICASILVLAGCGDRPSPTRGAEERASHAAASTAMDAAFNAEIGGQGQQPAAKPKPAPAKPAEQQPAAKPKPAEAAPAQGRPAWADQLPEEAGKLFAVGSAPKGRRDDARRKALQELASSLKVNIQSTTVIDEGEIVKIGPGGERVGRAWSNYRNDARLSVNRELTFSRIVAEADDGRESWALAELDRTAWAAKLRQEIGVVDGKLSAARDTLAKAGTGLRPAAQALAVAGPLAGRRDALVADLTLAEPGGAIPPCPVDLPALFATCAKGLASVVVTLEGAPDAVFAARTMDAMAKQGLSVNERAGSVVLRLALRETPRKLPNGWTRIAVAGSATVVDPATGAVAGSLQIDESASDPNEDQAKAKILDKASTAVAKAISEQLVDLLGR